MLHPDTTSRPVSIPTTTAVVDGENEASNMAYDNDDHSAELKENHDIFVTLNNDETQNNIVLLDNDHDAGNEKMMTGEQEKVTPLPKAAILAISIIFICEGFAYTFLFPFIGFMIVDFGTVKDKEDAGYYAGFLAASFAFTQFFTGFIYGVMADRFSKRLVVLVSTVGCMITMAMFGLSQSFWFALVVRGMNGALNGLTATAKAYLSDVTDKTNQSVAFSFLGLAWGIGAITGPTIGGFLSDPVTKYPKLFGNLVLFKKFPYLLPCLFCSVVMLLGFICCAFCMKEKKKTTVSSEGAVDNERVDESIMLETLPADFDHNQQQTEPVGSIEQENTLEEEQFQQSLTKIQEPTVVPQQSFYRRMQQGVVKETRELVGLMLNKEVMVASAIYFLCSTIDTIQEELWGLWALIDIKQGGLSFGTSQIGIAQMMIGIILLVQPIVFPFCSRLIGKLGSLRLGFLLIIPLLFTPQLNLLTSSKSLLWTGVVLMALLRAFTGMLTFTAVFIVINNAAPQGTAGRVMAMSNSAGCIARVIAPIMAGPMLAFSARLSTTYWLPLINIPFVFFAALSFVAVLLSFKFDNTINEPKV